MKTMVGMMSIAAPKITAALMMALMIMVMMVASAMMTLEAALEIWRWR